MLLSRPGESMTIPKQLRGALAALVFGLGCVSALAFKIDPLVRPDVVFKDRYQPFLDHLLLPIHERMAAMAYLCAKEKIDDEPCPGDRNLPAPSFEGDNDLAHGARWNDDPNNSFQDDDGLTWVLWMGNAELRVKEIDKTFALLYRSHFGDLQFLHAMAQTGDRHGKTQAKILAWCRFAYDVAIGAIPPTATLGSLMKDYPFARSFAGTSKERWTVRRLFLNVKDYKGGELEDIPDGSVPTIALGALLHTVQDSYSRSHTARLHPSNEESSQSGEVTGFLDYTQQKAHCHGEADFEAGWLENGSASSLDNPIFHGAWIIRRAIEKRNWDAVSGRFGAIFAVTDESGLAGDGGFKQCPRGSPGV